MTNKEEIWQNIKGYEGLYTVSNYGNVMSYGRWDNGGKNSTPRFKKPRMLKTSNDKKRYKHINLYDKDGNIKSYSVHELVLSEFKGERPQGLVSRHLDGNNHNNIITNLEYGTQQENQNDAKIHGTTLKGEKNPCSKITKEQGFQIFNLLQGGKQVKVIAKEYNVNECTIYQIKNKQHWTSTCVSTKNN